MTKDTHLHSYPEARVLMAPSGEIMVALPIYANHIGAFFDTPETLKIASLDLSIGMYEQIGYVAYHPQVGEIVLSKDSTSLGIEDLGPLD